MQYAFGWMVVHSLWQAVAIALISGVLMIILRKKSANLRYLVGNSALLLVLISAIATFTYYYQSEKAAKDAVLSEIFTLSVKIQKETGISSKTQQNNILPNVWLVKKSPKSGISPIGTQYVVPMGLVY